MTRFQTLPLKSTKPVKTAESERAHSFRKLMIKRNGTIIVTLCLITRYNLVQYKFCSTLCSSWPHCRTDRVRTSAASCSGRQERWRSWTEESERCKCRRLAVGDSVVRTAPGSWWDRTTPSPARTRSTDVPRTTQTPPANKITAQTPIRKQST